jgi:hypothetical protein
MKPLNRKAYGHIGHLPGSRVGKTDRYITPGQAIIATQQTRDKYDNIVIQEKVDGSCVAVCKVNGAILPITRAGNLACTSRFINHHLFYRWVMERIERFDKLLQEGERLVGEWIAQAHGTNYTILSNEEVFRAFDLMTEDKRLRYEDFMTRVAGKFETVPLISYGPPHTPEWVMDHFPISGCGAAQVEGWVWRVETRYGVDFLAKWVRPDYEAGKYLPDISNQNAVWNWRP